MLMFDADIYHVRGDFKIFSTTCRGFYYLFPAPLLRFLFGALASHACAISFLFVLHLIGEYHLEFLLMSVFWLLRFTF